MWVIRVFSGDRRRPIADRTPAISSRRASASALVPDTIRHQSSAYRTEPVVGQTVAAALWPVRTGWLRGLPVPWAMYSSRTDRATLLSNGDRIEPCGVPALVVPQRAVLTEDARLQERLHQGQDAFVPDRVPAPGP